MWRDNPNKICKYINALNLQWGQTWPPYKCCPVRGLPHEYYNAMFLKKFFPTREYAFKLISHSLRNIIGYKTHCFVSACFRSNAPLGAKNYIQTQKLYDVKREMNLLCADLPHRKHNSPQWPTRLAQFHSNHKVFWKSYTTHTRILWPNSEVLSVKAFSWRRYKDTAARGETNKKIIMSCSDNHLTNQKT
jgi:hypothetical protein